jgi:hypothetical protein
METTQEPLPLDKRISLLAERIQLLMKNSAAYLVT